MTEIPRKLPQLAAERQQIVQQRSGGGLTEGLLRSPAPVRQRSATPQGVPAFVTVDHLDDGNVARPIAAHVYWRGAAIPLNAEKTDSWYPSNDL